MSYRNGMWLMYSGNLVHKSLLNQSLGRVPQHAANSWLFALIETRKVEAALPRREQVQMQSAGLDHKISFNQRPSFYL